MQKNYILRHILPQILPQTTTTISTPSLQYFLCLRETQVKVLRGLQRFAKLWQESPSSTETLVLGF